MTTPSPSTGFCLGKKNVGSESELKIGSPAATFGGTKTVGIGSGVVVGSPLQAATAKDTPMSTSHLCQVAVE